MLDNAPLDDQIQEDLAPQYICHDCGIPFLRPDQLNRDTMFTMHEGPCDICGLIRAITAIRHYNYLKPLSIADTNS